MRRTATQTLTILLIASLFLGLATTLPAMAQDVRPNFCDWSAKTDSPVYRLAASQGKHIAAGCVNGDVHVFNVEDRSAFKLGSHTNQVTGMWFTPDGKILATAGLEGTVSIWNVMEKKRERQVACNGLIWSMSASPSNKRLAITVGGTGGERILLYDLDKFEMVGAFPRDEPRQKGRAVFVSEERLIASDNLADLQVVNVEDGKVMSSFNAKMLGWPLLAVSADRKHLAFGGFRAGLESEDEARVAIAVYEIKPGAGNRFDFSPRTLLTNKQPWGFADVEFFHKSRYVVTCASIGQTRRDAKILGMVSIWDLEHNKQVFRSEYDSAILRSCFNEKAGILTVGGGTRDEGGKLFFIKKTSVFKK